MAIDPRARLLQHGAHTLTDAELASMLLSAPRLARSPTSNQVSVTLTSARGVMATKELLYAA
jgi:DNA repair protein RadC